MITTIQVIEETGQPITNIVPTIFPSINNTYNKYGYYGPAIRLWGPVEYYCNSFLDKVRSKPLEELFCIDTGGRNFNHKGPCYVRVKDVIAFLKEHGEIIEREDYHEFKLRTND